jgi:hypothetical protein
MVLERIANPSVARLTGSNPVPSAKQVEDTSQRRLTGLENQGGVKPRRSIRLSSAKKQNSATTTGAN